MVVLGDESRAHLQHIYQFMLEYEHLASKQVDLEYHLVCYQVGIGGVDLHLA